MKCVLCDNDAITTAAHILVCSEHWEMYKTEAEQYPTERSFFEQLRRADSQKQTSVEEFRRMVYPDVVIWDTLFDLPKLKAMTPQGRIVWWRSLGDLERRQLVEVCGLVIGLGFSASVIEMVEAIKASQRARQKPRPK